MSGQNSFRDHCQNLAATLTADIKLEFAKINDDVGRIKFLYPLATRQQIKLAATSEKDYQRAETLKVSGNKLFQNRSFFYAVNVYNEALFRCPQDTPEGRRLRDILIANRSAVFFEGKEYRKVLRDVELVVDHPNPHKVYMRAGRSCEALKLHASAVNYYRKGLESLLSNTEVSDADKKKQQAEFDSKINSFKGKQLRDVNVADVEETEVKTKSITYPALSAKLVVKSSTELGRYVVAREDIKAGEILASEKPYVCVVNGDTYRSNCASCLMSTNQPIPCENCASACFCSEPCKAKASAFHATECKVLSILLDAGVSVNCLMAFRTVTQRSSDDVLAQIAALAKERNIVIYNTDDYYNVSNLVSHADRRSTDEFVHYTFMATYLLRLLKLTDYFGKPTEDSLLTEDETCIGSLILRNLQILQFNAHEISELHNDFDGASNYKSSSVGAGLYTTLALFNHSCDPSLVRYNVGNVMVLRAIKPIKMNEGVYENYGPLYTSDVRDSRIEKLREQYWFECSCQPCTEDWPLFQNIDSNVLRLRCECGSVILASKDLAQPFIQCRRCKKDVNIMPMLSALIPLGAKALSVEELFSCGNYKETMDIIVEMLQVYGKHLAPPFTDMIMLQQRLKTCIVHLGNKGFAYKSLPQDTNTRMQNLAV